MKEEIEIKIKQLEMEIEEILNQRKICQKLDFDFEAKVLVVKYSLLTTFKNELRDLIREKGD